MSLNGGCEAALFVWTICGIADLRQSRLPDRSIAWSAPDRARRGGIRPNDLLIPHSQCFQGAAGFLYSGRSSGCSLRGTP